MAAFASIVTVEDFNEYMREEVKPEDDKLLDFKQRLILRCVPAIEKYTGLLMQTSNFSETFDGNGEAGLWLTYRPINSITSVTSNGSIVAATEYYIKSKINFLRFKNALVSGFQNYVIVYSAGYGYTNGVTANNVPQPLRDACLRWTAYNYKKANDRRHGVSAISAGDQSVTYFEKGMPEDVAELLNPLVIPLARATN